MGHVAKLCLKISLSCHWTSTPQATIRFPHSNTAGQVPLGYKHPGIYVVIPPCYKDFKKIQTVEVQLKLYFHHPCLKGITMAYITVNTKSTHTCNLKQHTQVSHRMFYFKLDVQTFKNTQQRNSTQHLSSFYLWVAFSLWCDMLHFQLLTFTVY